MSVVRIERILHVLIWHISRLVLFEWDILGLFVVWTSRDMGSLLIHHVGDLLRRALQELANLALALVLDRVITFILVSSARAPSNTFGWGCRWSRGLNSWLTHVGPCTRCSYFFSFPFLLNFDVLTLDIFYHIVLTVLTDLIRAVKVKRSLLLIAMPSEVMTLRPRLYGNGRLLGSCWTFPTLAVCQIRLVHLHMMRILPIISGMPRLSLIPLMRRVWNRFFCSTLWLFTLVVRNVFQFRVVIRLILMKLAVIVLNEKIVVCSLISFKFWYCHRLRWVTSFVSVLLYWCCLHEVLGCFISEFLRALINCLV